MYNLYSDTIQCYHAGQGAVLAEEDVIDGIDSAAARDLLGDEYEDFLEQIELVRGASHEFSLDAFLAGQLTPVFFGTALGNFGVREMLNDFVEWAPAPQSRPSSERTIEASQPDFTGFVFKIQANMDPKHRDRIALCRICSGRYDKGMKMRHVRLDKDVRIADAVTFRAGIERSWNQRWLGTSLVCITTVRSKLVIRSLPVKRYDSPASLTSRRNSFVASASPIL